MERIGQAKPVWAAPVLAALAPWLLLGCAARDLRQAPMDQDDRPAQIGAYDFDLLEQTSGKGCMTRILTIPLNPSHVVRGAPVIHRPACLLCWLLDGPLLDEAHAAAAYDALTKVPEADTLLVTRSAVDGYRFPPGIPLLFSHYCAELRGRAIRLKKASDELNRLRLYGGAETRSSAAVRRSIFCSLTGLCR